MMLNTRTKINKNKYDRLKLTYIILRRLTIYFFLSVYLLCFIYTLMVIVAGDCVVGWMGGPNTYIVTLVIVVVITTITR